MIAVTSLILLLAASGHAAPVCTDTVENRRECGWFGISESECSARGCCYDMQAGTTNWCFLPSKPNPCVAGTCRSYETCVPDLNGDTYECVCPTGRTADGKCNTEAKTECAIEISKRKNCGWETITEDECDSLGCCFEINSESIAWCYRKTTDVDPCINNPCRRDEVCERNGQEYVCTCPAGRTGTVCTKADSECSISLGSRKPCGWFGISEAECADQDCCFEINALTANWCYIKGSNPCDDSPCKNGGACSENGDSFTCTCANTWSGSDCGTPNPCGSSPCQNGGACTNDGDSYSCACSSVWSGNNCETANPCGSSPCKNGGACTNDGDSFTCACSAGWTGSNCEEVADPCGSRPCKNGGTCTSSGTSFTCNCVPGWTGSDCTTDVNVCLISNPCKNGGKCVKFGDSYTCHCSENWAGANCEMGSQACSKVPATERVNCGWGGVTLAQCNAQSCCFEPLRGRPSCYYADANCETIDFKLRVECGFPGISYWQCLGRGCCFDDDETSNPKPNPLCYRKANPACVGVKAEDRIAQGDSGIQPNECNADNWCWDSNVEPNCFTVKE